MSRDKFEAWWEINYHNGNPPRFGWAAYREDGGYKIDDDESELDAMWNAWQAATNAAEAKCAALAAENAALKAFGGKLGDMHNDLNGEGTGIQARAEVAIQQVALEAAIEEFDTIKTPATDTFLAEVRAQGVEMFAKEMHADISEADALEFAAQLRQGANTAELVAAGIITKVGE
ncbi:hypothetical protein [Leclercia sp.]|uniref:hypothetical protein n=1 Tax=Leclercia sp. TaxID=1898428 RepID=UPI0028A6EEF4|nr:hypothetical protein [Leclercia sp.]